MDHERDAWLACGMQPGGGREAGPIAISITRCSNHLIRCNVWPVHLNSTQLVRSAITVQISHTTLRS